MKSFKNLATLICLIISLSITAQEKNKKSEIEMIRTTLMDYIEGTANGQPDRLKRAFHPDFKLYTVRGDSAWARSGKRYIANIKKGKKSNRIGRIIAIDYENNAASAKVEILMPNYGRMYTDYFLLLKYKGSWKIVQKSYTFRPYPVKQ
ncbi:MAG: nuclear transport factor 2 family protein [Flavobacteriaceae bacterium]|nr:nuclear transport factor 2 family protein [Flavobacteriaceae bacterium]